MKRLALTVTALLAFIISCYGQELEKRCERFEIKDQGLSREAFLYVPECATAGAPVIIVLHGYGGSGAKGKVQFINLADKEGFAVCYPTGAKDPKGKNSWNVGYPFQIGWKQDDMKFLKHLISFLHDRYGLSRENVFLTGMSNGGEMCYLAAMESPQTFRAIASIAGLTLSDMSRNYRKPVPFMEVHGTSDKTSLWYGDPENEGGWGAYLPVPLAVSYITSANCCTCVTKEEMPAIRNKVTKWIYSGGIPIWENGPAADVLLYEIENGTHSWGDKDMDTYGETWKFFKKYIR